MLDLDKYLYNSVEMRIGGEVIHVMQPTLRMIDKVDMIEKDLTEDNINDKRMDVAILFLNHNKEGRKFEKQDLYDWTTDAITNVINTMSVLRYEAESDPN